jgi:GDSL-like Lipase/Acylhydrolase family
MSTTRAPVDAPAPREQRTRYEPAAVHEPSPNAGAPAAACRAPSTRLTAPADGRDAAALAKCRFATTGADAIGDACGSGRWDQAVPLPRIDEAVLALDASTRDHVRMLAARGRELGRRRGVFLLVGDSITASPKFMTPFTGSGSFRFGQDVAQALAIGDGHIVARYRVESAVSGLDSFVAPRAAKVGAQSRWALRGGPASPLLRALEASSPAVAVVLYGSNDAAVRAWPLDEIAERFRKRMNAILDHLEQAGVVPILNTVPRHTLDPKRAPCDRSPSEVSNWRLAVQTNVVSAVAAELACERELPLIDLRWALDAIANHGIGPDGVHPNAYRGGAGVLDEQGLQCGYNVRNYVTLRMLTRLWPLLDGDPAAAAN